MKRNKRFNLIRKHWLFGALLIGITGFAIWGLPTVPFHPDEATYLYMSKDLDTFFTHPGLLGFDETQRGNQDQIYRTIDAPITRYLLGLGRHLFGLPALRTDWNWTLTWNENVQTGALPSETLLFAGRLSVTLLLPFSLLLIYAIGIQLGGRNTGLVVTILLGMDALVLLHARRAMAEGPLIFGVLLTIWSFLKTDTKPWLAGLGMAVAFNTKQSALALLPVGLLAILWTIPPWEYPTANISRTNQIKNALVQFISPAHLRQIGIRLLIFFAVFGTITFALNPVYWRNTREAFQASVTSRADLLSRQVADVKRLAPEKVLDTATIRAAVMLGQLYMLPLQFFEIGNYQGQTAAMEQAYLAIPGHTWFRGVVGGGVLLGLTLLGMIRGGMDIYQKGISRTRDLVLLFFATGVMGAGLLIAVPLPFQRYPIPLLPLLILWMGMAVKGKK